MTTDHMSEWDSATTYEVGDEITYTPRKVVTLTGFAWLWAKMTGKPTQWTEEGQSQVYRVGVDIPSNFKWMDINESIDVRPGRHGRRRHICTSPARSKAPGGLTHETAKIEYSAEGNDN